MKDQGLPALTVVLTKLHAGGKFGQGGYKVSGGLHGVGVSVVNALSEWLVAEVQRDGKIYRRSSLAANPSERCRRPGVSRETGTTISFLPDAEVFEELELSADTLKQRLREMAFLTKGLMVVLTDERAGGDSVTFHYEGGIRDFVAYTNEAKDPRSTSTSSTSTGATSRATSRSRCNGTTRIRSRSSRSQQHQHA
jgi:DNA gyrase subunit B